MRKTHQEAFPDLNEDLQEVQEYRELWETVQLRHEIIQRLTSLIPNI